MGFSHVLKSDNLLEDHDFDIDLMRINLLFSSCIHMSVHSLEVSGVWDIWADVELRIIEQHAHTHFHPSIGNNWCLGSLGMITGLESPGYDSSRLPITGEGNVHTHVHSIIGSMACLRSLGHGTEQCLRATWWDWSWFKWYILHVIY